MDNSTSDKQKIKENIENSLKNETILAILFKDINNSHKHPQLVTCDSIVGSKFTFTGLLPTDFFGQQFIVDLNDILGCGTYDVKSVEYGKVIMNYLKK
jgi:hypothetical protein